LAKALAAIFVMSLIIPLMVWGGTGSFKRAVEALRGWWLIMAGLFAFVGVFALWAIFMDRIG